LKRSIDGSDPPVDYSEEYDSTSTNPAAHALIGRAEGIAAALGAPVVSRDHVLIAYLWDTSSDELEMRSGVTPRLLSNAFVASVSRPRLVNCRRPLCADRLRGSSFPIPTACAW
jgi:hypothetical protein